MMRGRFLARIIGFVMILGIAVSFINRILVPKYLYDNEWPTTQTFTDFYKLDKNSIDVIFLGSSHCVSAFSPLELYEKYGISSYNLGSEQQNLLISYYWLKEAIRYQSPSVVVLDTYFLYPNDLVDLEDNPLNSSEASIRKSLDYMRWSGVKMEAVSKICSVDTSQHIWSYVFPNIRFHNRWKSLEEDDFTFVFSPSHEALMGYSALNGETHSSDNIPFDGNEEADELEPIALMKEYLDDIVELCQSQDIQLILVKTPATQEDINKYKYLKDYSEGNNISFIDFNEDSVYSKLEYDFSKDNCSAGHLTFYGATKVTDYIGEILTEECGIKSVYSEEHEKLLDYYASVRKDFELPFITDIYEYLDAINDSRYAVFIAIKDEGTKLLDDRMIEELNALGVKSDLIDKLRYSFYAVINGDEEDENISQDLISSEGTICDGEISYSIISAGYDSGNRSSIMIDGTEYSINSRGLNIVVYDKDRRMVIDSVSFDTWKDLSANR